MKKLLLGIVLLFTSLATTFAQGSELPSTQIIDAKGKKVPFNSVFEPGKVTLVSFWATWCIPCIKEIKNIRKHLPEWQKETEFNYVAVSIDDSRSSTQAKSYAKSQGWEFPNYLDPNSDLKRSLNFENVPFTIIVGKDGKIAYMHSGYEEGGELLIYEKIKELSAK